MLEGLVELAGVVPHWVLLGVVFLMGGGAGAAIKALRDIALRTIEAIDDEPEPRCMRPIDVLQDSDKMWTSLDRLRRGVEAQRVLLCRQENGGKLPRVGAPLTSSIDLESTGEDVKSIKLDWQRQLLDEYLTRALVRTYDEGGLAIEPEQAKGIMRGWLASSGDPTIHLFPVYATEGAFYYLVVGFKPEHLKGLADAVYRDQVRITTANIVTIFEKWYSLSRK